ncbi:MAG: DUF1385 domain-containing protein [Eubacteriales bacterium]|nr:DUF1385 domain-containing protein [Eubacteriales bacterium]
MKRTSIGGQAVMEGIMMKNGDQYAVCVRKPNQEIVIKKDEYQSVTQKYPILNMPILRGVCNFGESLYVGMKTLTFSAEFLEEEAGQEEAGRVEKALQKILGEKMDDILMGFTMCLSVVLAVAIFMILPFFLSELLKNYIPSHMVRTLIEGVFRVSIFLLYVVAISRMSEIKRVFMYHGAEHKTINCLESGDPLTPENVMKHSRLHKRCGTSFLLIVMIISIIVFMFIRVDTLWLRFLSRILLVPVVAGISYEFLRLAGRNNSALVNFLSKPGLCLQYLTTKEPDVSMIEVAIASVESIFDWEAYQEAMRNGEIED